MNHKWNYNFSFAKSSPHRRGSTIRRGGRGLNHHKRCLDRRSEFGCCRSLPLVIEIQLAKNARRRWFSFVVCSKTGWLVGCLPRCSHFFWRSEFYVTRGCLHLCCALLARGHTAVIFHFASVGEGCSRRLASRLPKSPDVRLPPPSVRGMCRTQSRGCSVPSVWWINNAPDDVSFRDPRI